MREGRARCQGSAAQRNGVHRHLSGVPWWPPSQIPPDLTLGVTGKSSFCWEDEGCSHNEMQELYLHIVNTGINWTFKKY